MTSHPVSRYVPLLIEGDLEGLLEIFGNVPRVNDPRLGWVQGTTFERFVSASHQALSRQEARVEHLVTTSTALGAVEECMLSLVRRGNIVHLPVAVAAAVSSEVLDAVHVYHSMWPLMGAHAIRPPILARVASLVLPDTVGRYHDSLARGDAHGVVKQFAPDGLLREPAGEPHVHQGTITLQRLFGGWLSGGGISLERCSLTDDGRCCALEYNVTAWGRMGLPHQAGIAVYQRAPTGLLSAARIYDDVEAPWPVN